ncbi:MAG: hypothetical protein A3B99_04620 [Candidatus Yanofskybacteria bacterium RIFCSPHIGHO2_02_FULL_44_12b]|uniref:Endonuclease/exonuclease/phosphatase domain-containing protein n=2 Tax=Candidatus Yanofskyibacteriota TaxID=1752733 RepID=A0A1F8GL53_9BACT|nr:MAG: hypothetical protein UW79_C0013G0061 [Candidatus Yanofskybacteria bacterium GW2011_GWA2_44_9]OGN04350.1 MAG: hypothetical protein A2659_03420 [Candidatus Yanofskybacteria bacterium RIFCSPHIGHO2_01_FULL_44_24]OGN14459.1 MAG: hypothetical protein A3B99_04620 [Candidatus Yanofskybacteria bacterium RIFCSPHIGHO2_02_FULL_44_12b]OGN25740.1 MAG: hypothetical protein A2925_00960 [Candidatus Yanofskybacteria bacterium RIFCSPLOWO2_01_FULL_44_22]
MRITLATYNILHGYHADLILKNLAILVEKSANIICIQEADPPFKNLLNDFVRNKKWQVIYFYDTKGCNLAIAWNPEFLRFQGSENILLPMPRKPSLAQRIIIGSIEKLQRGALSASFLASDKVIRVTNAHLAWEGGIKHTLLQLGHLKWQLNKRQNDHEVLAGDFNTFAPSILRKIKQRKVEEVLGECWTNQFPNIFWTCDTSYVAPQDGVTPYANFLRSLGIKMRSRLDYIFTLNLNAVSGEMLDLPGSDHRPVIGIFEI